MIRSFPFALDISAERIERACLLYPSKHIRPALVHEGREWSRNERRCRRESATCIVRSQRVFPVPRPTRSPQYIDLQMSSTGKSRSRSSLQSAHRLPLSSFHPQSLFESPPTALTFCESYSSAQRLGRGNEPHFDEVSLFCRRDKVIDDSDARNTSRRYFYDFQCHVGCERANRRRERGGPRFADDIRLFSLGSRGTNRCETELCAFKYPMLATTDSTVAIGVTQCSSAPRNSEMRSRARKVGLRLS